MATTPFVDDIIRIPAYSRDSEKDAHKIHWSQNMCDRSGTYYAVHAENLSRGGNVILFIQDNWYNYEKIGTGHVSKISQEANLDVSFDIKIDGRFQYGQKDRSGKDRFVVYHDMDRKLFQHRFIETATQGKAAEWLEQFITNSQADSVANYCKGFVGDYLRTFM